MPAASKTNKDNQPVITMSGQKLMMSFSGNDDDLVEWNKISKDDLGKFLFDLHLMDTHLCVSRPVFVKQTFHFICEALCNDLAARISEADEGM